MSISEGGNPRNNFLTGSSKNTLSVAGVNIKWHGPVTLLYYESISSNKQTYRLYSNVIG